MKPIRQYSWGRLILVLAPIVAVALTTWPVAASLERRKMNEHEQLGSERLSKSMRTVCVGRFLIDSPAAARVELSSVRINGFDIATFSESTPEFQRCVADRRAQLEPPIGRLGGRGNLESERFVLSDDGVTGTIFLHSRTVTEGTRARGLGLERYRHENVALEALLHASGTSIDVAASEHDPGQAENLNQLVVKLKPDSRNRPSSETVCCIDKAYFHGPMTAEQGESIVMRAHLPSHPDIGCMFIVAAGIKLDDLGLLERSAAARAGLPLLDRMRISTLRAEKRKIAHLDGEESVERAIEKNGSIAYGFWWEVNGTEHNLFEPHIVLQMTTGQGTGGPVSSSLSQDAAFKRWNTNRSSIRLNKAPR